MTAGAPPRDARLDGVRVLVALYYYSPYSSGLTIYARALAEHLAGRGAEVEVVAGMHQRGLARVERIDGVTVTRVRSLAAVGKGMVLPGFVPAVARRARRADVVMPVMPLLEAAAVAAVTPRGRLLPVYVCDLRLGADPLSRVVEALAARSARWTVGRAPAFIALSTDYAASSRVVGHVAARSVGVRPPVDTDRFTAGDAAGLRVRLGLDGRRVVGFVGRLVAEKGIDVLIAAVREVRRTMPDVTLVIAGEGDRVAGGGLGDDLRAQVRPDDDVRFTGFLSHDDLRAFYAMCDVVALPSVDPLEAFGMVQVEAMLCGTPVVASDMPGVRFPVTATGMGLLAPPGDVAGVADALRRVLDGRAGFVRPRDEVVGILDPHPALAALVDLVAARAGR